jgi:hypothetical protein
MLGFGIAFLFTWLELVTSKYPRTFSFPSKRWAIWLYCLIYGLIAFGVLVGFDALVVHGLIKADGLGLSMPWMRAIEIGIAAKALLHIRLFTVTAGSQPFPVGVETLVQVFEPWLLDRVAQDEDDQKRDYVNKTRNKYPAETDPQIKAKLKANIRRSLPFAEKSAIALDIDMATTGDEAMTVYLDRFGTSSLKRLYP